MLQQIDFQLTSCFSPSLIDLCDICSFLLSYHPHIHFDINESIMESSTSSLSLNLLQFPPDILTHIFRTPSSSVALLLLWKCGNKALQDKLANSVDTVDLLDYNRNSTSRWPKMLSCLKSLRYLRLVRLGGIAPPVVLSEEVRKLSSELLELEIRSTDSAYAILDFRTMYASGLPSYEESYEVREGDVWNIGEKFPKLRKLILWARPKKEHRSIIYTRLQEVVPFVPPTLEHLAINLMSSTEFESLPPSLKRIEVAMFPCSSKFPPQIEYISAIATSQSSVDEFSAILSLTNLNSVKWAIHQGDCSHVAPIASASLETLHLSFRPYTRETIKLPLNWFPPTLTSLTMGSFIVNVNILQQLPSSLTHLQNIELDWSDIKLHLESSADVGRGCDVGLGCDVGRGSDDGRLEALKKLWPKNLRLLILGRSQYATINISDPSYISLLPSTLEHLDMGAEPRPGEGFKTFEWNCHHLPRLRKLVFFCEHLSFPNGLPQYLVRLTVGCSMESFMQLSSCIRDSAITSLCLRLQSRPEVEGENLYDHEAFLAVLPRKVEKLRLYFNEFELNWTPEAWCELPSERLKVLVIQDLNQQEFRSTLEGSCVLPHLPPSITHLCLPLCSLDLSDLLQMPCHSNLREFQMDWFGEDYFSPNLAMVAAWPDVWDDEVGVNWARAFEGDPWLTKQEYLQDQQKAYPDWRVSGYVPKMKKRKRYLR